MLHNTVIQTISPAIDLLKHQGAWVYVLDIYHKLYVPVNKSTNWILHLTSTNNFDVKMIIHWVVASVYFIVNLFITLFHVLINIFEWIQNVARGVLNK